LLSEDFPDGVVGIAGYQLHRRDRKTRRDGVSLNVSSTIQSKTIGLEFNEEPNPTLK